MGFDLSVRWGRVIDEKAWQEGTAFDAVDFPTEWDEDQELLCIPAYGMIHHNIMGMSIIRAVSSKLEAPNPFYFCLDYTRWTHTEMIVLDERWIKELEQFRDEQLRPWLRRYQNKQYENQADISERELDYYAGSLIEMIGFINFIVAHRTKENIYMHFSR